MINRRHLLAALAGLSFAGPTLAQTVAPTGTASGTAPIKVVATFSILGDFVRAVGKDRVALTTLVGPDGDAHVYTPSPNDGKVLAEAALIVTNGLKFEGWIDRLVKASGAKAPVIMATKGVTTLKAAGGHSHGHGHGHGHSHAEVDPHAWQNVLNAKIYAVNIRDALIAVDPEGAAGYRANTEAYLAELDTLETEIRAALARVPAEKRRIITSHDAFAYFGAAYGIRFIAPRGVSTEAEASAQDVARLIRQIRAEKITAVFVETISDPRLIERIAKETGARVGGRIYSDALSKPAGPAPTYIEMMRHNIRTLAGTLTS